MAAKTAPDLDGVDVPHARDRAGHAIEPWARRVGMLMLAAVSVLALLNFFGQHASNSSVTTPVATLTLHTPNDVRRGLLYESRFTITAHTSLTNAVLHLNPGWANGLTMNTIEPSPVDETSDQGSLVFTLGPIDAGDTYVFHLQYQVNPTTAGSRTQVVSLTDGKIPVASLTRHLMVWP